MECFYLLLQLTAIALNFGVLIFAVYEGIYARRGGDPTKIRVVTDPHGATINNPGYREYHQPTNGKRMDSSPIFQNPRFVQISPFPSLDTFLFDIMLNRCKLGK